MNKIIYRLGIKALNSKFLNRLLYGSTRCNFSKKFIPKYISHFKINTDELVKQPSDYNSLNDFFTRKIDMGKRPFGDSPSDFCSPCDGAVSHIGKITENIEFIIKNKPYSIVELLNRSDLNLIGGDYVLIYLSPADYHRFHAPIDAAVLENYRLGKTSEPVNDLGLSMGNAPIVKNYRCIEYLRTKNFSYYTVYIGAVNVNSIVLHEKNAYKKGEEVGYFQFGSSILLLFPPNVIDIDFPVNSKIKVGEKIGVLY